MQVITALLVLLGIAGAYALAFSVATVLVAALLCSRGWAPDPGLVFAALFSLFAAYLAFSDGPFRRDL
jgi:hypothetical protein